ncbi:MAG TPA: nucleoside triphosphate pyrophosphatase [Opitutaceae bacterium]|nr:nucleoside triphosphate pyrophosphatase [Opitutaceae bacterium]
MDSKRNEVAGNVRLILASASPRRRELLARLGLAFEVVPADVVEHEPPGSDDPRGLVLHNAALKAEAVAAANPGAIVLGADTTVFLGGEVFHKPANLGEARVMLRKLSGHTHTVFTGLAVRGRGLALEGSAESHVKFRTLRDADIDAFFERCDPTDKAGGYGIQEGGELIVESFEGPLDNIIGLPLQATEQILTLAGLRPTLMRTE